VKKRIAHTEMTPRPTGDRPRPKRVTLLRCLMLICFFAGAGTGAAFAANPLALDLAMKSASAAQPPRMVGDTLILTYRPDRPARSVGVRFEHESWAILHLYEVNEKGLFVLGYPLPEGLLSLRYRIIVDGLSMTDPMNETTSVDELGNVFSVFTLDKEPSRPIVNPRAEKDGAITFTFHGTPGRRVALVGDFNNWDPFMTPLKETAPGVFSVTVRVPAGGHWYYFMTEGRRVLDGFNARTGTDPDGDAVSYFSLSL
jgi:hypothetical protein